MLNKTAKAIIEKSENYTPELFEQDFQDMLDAYNTLPPVDPDEIRKEISKWDLSVNKDDVHDFDIMCETYAKFVAYQSRAVFLMDKVKRHDTTLDVIIDNVKTIYAQFVEGTAKVKDAKSATLLKDLNLLYTEVHTLMQYIKDIQEKSIEFNTQQLARILREREAMAKVNGDYYKQGLSSNIRSRRDVEIRTKPRN